MACIIRLDKPKNSTKGTHGWQVRVPTGEGRKYHSKLFSDNKHGGRDEALAAAKEYLADQPQAKHPANKPYHKGSPLSNNKSGVTGVYREKYISKGQLYNYWCAFVPRGPEGQRRWHKRFSVERYGYETARDLAIEFRREWEKAIEKGEQALEAFFDEYHYEQMIDTRFGSEDKESYIMELPDRHEVAV